ncbi:DUF2268 domain-containing protein [Virgibacillus pantothenticus]|uniref:DUF2268 domain-containing protein n=1 Tax=Virgibacillus pantothenticus TaxID=1473 RepID=UPI001C21AF3E|nr:DUF2268 domain-containing protein [Virgibacillus pantothenticus]MBU8568926.1 DUF2268 domain-containing protein [Virgibacillus pantothenticus]MBU8602940.1 DUF2268 domain-containing protein [Virgibacillus pantothenticus]MBU8637030.1 DUF2268 domain-containing protein [Virgibacillus pantothenticus]MBU8644818.1 DUF2268 domain-containing protein [Virgibacillus pantothenticus]MBU8648939.1 DUF2268 domain-containing protein [Virgibacillus pantothenticus]
MSLIYKLINTIEQYEELLAITELEERKEYFRYKMMAPFKEMWNLINVPIKAKQENGYDVLMATNMLGYADIFNDIQIQQGLSILKENNAYEMAETTIKTCVENVSKAGLKVNADEIKFGLYVADPYKLKLQKGYTGFGGIPGFITVNIFPNDYNIPKMPAVIAHEFHHNIRFSYFDWDHGNVTVGDYLVIEGLADSFAKELYGTEQLGPWVTSMDKDDLEYSIYVIGEALNTKGFAEVSSYMFGDEIAKQEGYQPVGLSFCAGYAVGFKVVQSFMKKHNKTIYETTLLSSDEIINGSGLF